MSNFILYVLILHWQKKWKKNNDAATTNMCSHKMLWLNKQINGARRTKNKSEKDWIKKNKSPIKINAFKKIKCIQKNYIALVINHYSRPARVRVKTKQRAWNAFRHCDLFIIFLSSLYYYAKQAVKSNNSLVLGIKLAYFSTTTEKSIINLSISIVLS